MKRLRDMKWEDYGISKNLHAELKAFCLQYEEKKAKLTYGIKAMNYSDMPHGTSQESETERQAIYNEAYSRDCEFIEQAAIKTSAEIYPYIIKSVTYDLPYEYIMYDEKHGQIPVGKTDFYAYRRLFFYNLNKAKMGR